MSEDCFWTLQEFTTVAGKPWYALQKQNDGGIVWQFTGYLYEVIELAERIGVVPEELAPITEDEFFARLAVSEQAEDNTRAIA
jgi:hypothetical protein